MPRCLICGSNFYYQTRDDQAESCDCGAEIDTYGQVEAGVIEQKRAAWDKACEDAMKPEGEIVGDMEPYEEN